MKKSSHWYRADGSACHEVPNKSKPGTTRATTLKDARALGLFPSVTTILDLLDKPQLTDWKLEQLTAEFQRRAMVLTASSQRGADVIAGLTEIAHREFDQLHTELCDRAFQQVEDAADAGKLIHAAAEKALNGSDFDVDDEPLVFLPELNERFPMRTFIDPIKKFVAEHDIHPTGHEVKIVNQAHGYAGTGDLPMSCRKGLGFGDWKTRKTKPGKEVRAYDHQVMQIGAYHGGHYASVPRPGDFVAGFNLFISTTEPGRIEAVWYSAEEVAAAYEAFTHLAALWRFLKGYDPRPKADPRGVPTSGAVYADRPY